MGTPLGDSPEAVVGRDRDRKYPSSTPRNAFPSVEFTGVWERLR